MTIDLAAELRNLSPTGPAPTIGERRRRWPGVAATLAALITWCTPATPGEPVVTMTPPGVYEQIQPSAAIVAQRCGGTPDRSRIFAATEPAEFAEGQWCQPGFNRSPAQPPFEVPPPNPLATCADVAGYPSFEGWTLQATGAGLLGWTAILTSKNGWEATCNVANNDANVQFHRSDPNQPLIFIQGLVFPKTASGRHTPRFPSPALYGDLTTLSLPRRQPLRLH